MSNSPKGMYVPVVTPFKEDQSIDFEAFKEIIENLACSGLDGILIAGSTGEYHMMSLEEHKEVIMKGCEYVAGRMAIVCGVGMSTSFATIEMANFAAKCGADYGLVLPPYYQTTTEEGIRIFFNEIADGSDIGIWIYNYPFGIGFDLRPEFIAELAQHKNIVALKDTAEMIHTAEVVALTKENKDFTVFQGMEHLILPAMAIGADGGFAILMNALPDKYVELYKLVGEEKWEEAAALNRSMAKLYSAMEKEPFPAPVKTLMEMLGLPGGFVRKPLVPTSEELAAQMKEELIKLGYNPCD